MVMIQIWTSRMKTKAMATDHQYVVMVTAYDSSTPAAAATATVATVTINVIDVDEKPDVR